MVAVNHHLGVGLYTPGEAALYSRLAVTTMMRWLRGENGGHAVLRPEAGADAERSVTFLDFVQLLAIHDIRTQHRLPLQKIREAVRRAEDEYQLNHPLARRHVTFLLGDEIVILPEGSEDLVQVTGRQKHQMVMRRIVEVYLKDLTFGEDGLAVAYKAFRWLDVQIEMDPKRRFGEPLVKSCGYTAQALWEAAKAEGSIEAAAEAYGVQPIEVEAAFRYFNLLEGKAAA